MLKLMKYEFRKTLSTKLILLGATAAVEIGYLISLYTESEDALGVCISLLTMLAFGGVMMMGLESVLTLHRDMNTKQSYMLFMTPNSCHTILGAKVLECGLSILVAGAFFFALGLLDITLLFAHTNDLHEMWRMIQDVVASINDKIRLDTPGVASFVFSLLARWIFTVNVAYLADVVSAALLNGKKHNGVLSFVLFLALSFLIGRLSSWTTQGIADFNLQIVAQGGIALVFSAVMYEITAQIMERKLSV